MNEHNINLGNEIIRLSKARVDVKQEVLYKLKINFQFSFLNKSKVFLEEAWNYVNELENPEQLIELKDAADFNSQALLVNLTKENQIFKKINDVIDTLSKHQKTLQQIRFLNTQQIPSPPPTGTTTPTTTPNLENDQNEKWIKDLLFSIVQLKQYYIDFISTIIKYSNESDFKVAYYLMEELLHTDKVTITSDSFQRPFYRINKSMALKILNLNQQLQPIQNNNNDYGGNYQSSLSEDDLIYSFSVPQTPSISLSPFSTPSISSPNNVSPPSTPSFQVVSPTLISPPPSTPSTQSTSNTTNSFWKTTQQIHFSSSNLISYKHQVMVNKLFQLLDIPFSPSSLLIIQLSPNQSPYYVQSFWGIDNGKDLIVTENYNCLDMVNKFQNNNNNQFLDINLVSFSEQILGTLLVCPKESKFKSVQSNDILGQNSTPTQTTVASNTSNSLPPLPLSQQQHQQTPPSHPLPQPPSHSHFHSHSHSNSHLQPNLQSLLQQSSTLSLIVPSPLKSPISFRQQQQNQQLPIKSQTLISIKNDSINFQEDFETKNKEKENNIFYNSPLLKLPQMQKPIPIIFQKFITNINAQFLMIQWLSKLDEFNQTYQQLVSNIKHLTNPHQSPSINQNNTNTTNSTFTSQEEIKLAKSSSFSSMSSVSSSSSSSLSYSLSTQSVFNNNNNNNDDHFYLKLNLPIKVNKKMVEVIQKRFQSIQDQLKKNSSTTFSDLFYSVFPNIYTNYRELVLCKKNSPMPMITITFSPDSQSSPPNSTPLTAHIKSSSFSSNINGYPITTSTTTSATTTTTPINSSSSNTNSTAAAAVTKTTNSPISSNYNSNYQYNRTDSNRSNSSNNGMTKSHSSSFSTGSRSNSNLTELLLPNQIISTMDIDKFKMGEIVFQSILVNFHLDSKKLPLNVIYSKLVLLVLIKATHFSQSRSIKEMYRLISKHLKNQNQINIFNQKFKPIFKQLSNDNPHLQLNWILLIEEWFPDEWENPKQLFPRSTNEIKGSFFGKRLLTPAIHQHLFTPDGQFIKRNKYGKKDVSWYPEKEPVWYFKKYPEIAGYEYAATELMRSLGIKNLPYSELILFYDPQLKKSYPVLLTLAVQGKCISDIWLSSQSNITSSSSSSSTSTSTSIPNSSPTTNFNSHLSEINENLLDKHNTGLLIISSLLLSVEDGKPDNFILSDNGKYLTPIDNDRCFIAPSTVCEKGSSFIYVLMEQKKKLVMKSILFNLSMMKEKVDESVQRFFLDLDCFEFLKEWLENLIYVHDRYSTLLPEEELNSLYNQNNCIVRIFFTTQMIHNLYNTLLNIQYHFKYSITNSYLDLISKLFDPFVFKQYQLSFNICNNNNNNNNDQNQNYLKSSPTILSLQERYKSMVFYNNGINNLKQIVNMLGITNQELFGEAVRVKNEPSTALAYLKKMNQRKQDIKNTNQKILMNSSPNSSPPNQSPPNSISNLSTCLNLSIQQQITLPNQLHQHQYQQQQLYKQLQQQPSPSPSPQQQQQNEMINTIDVSQFNKKQCVEFEKKFKNEFPNAESFSIHNSLFTDSYIKKLSFSHIQFLDLRNSEKLTRASLGYLIKITPELIYLNISGWKSLKKLMFTSNSNFEMGLIDLNQLVTLEDETQIPPTKLNKLVVNDCCNLEIIDFYCSMPQLKTLDCYRNNKLEKVRLNYNVKLNTDIDDSKILKRPLNFIILGDKNVGKTSVIKLFKYKSSIKLMLPNFYESTFENPIPVEILNIIESKIKSNCFCGFNIILVYDCFSEESLVKCKKWLYNFKKIVDPCDYIRITLIGNKYDLLSIKVNDNDVNSFSREFNIKTFKISTKQNNYGELNIIGNHLFERCSQDCRIISK
ncbi:Rab GTPase domain-containing protein [Dictyostelium discoideum AX4]|uniref:Rab GTPase domain-containing protein n=1 Tax=Dictyostelium discoideum TaxID=44689 RepID=Q54KW5_DICDI|nr:Rab GTPase domain-containing protein [Dictyostelium discoideum AX4]EAL63895.1 Rab GTPase domain-containing protein [Dictyostelium discoideum AX4]|eukprot:XP_637405.1 Rab GTPase domain-containing protein [Dictyostelium discoideum AX4]